jgi:hypothetical protein
MSFYIPGTKTISNTSNGYVGVNTLTPNYNLDVLGNINLSGQLLNNGSSFIPDIANSVTSGQPNQILFNYSGSSTGSNGLTFNSDTSTLTIGSSGSIFYNSTGINFNSNLTPSTNDLTLGTLENPWKSLYVSTGTVFIGPTGSILINSNGLVSSTEGFAAPYFQVGSINPGNGILLYEDNNLLYFTNTFGITGAVSVFNITPGSSLNTYYSLPGNVGFGVTGPQQKIDVLGNIKASDTVIAQNFTGTNLSISSIESVDSTLNIATTDNKTNTVNIGTSNSIQTVNIGTVGSGNTTINLGGVGDTVNVAGTLVYVNSTTTQISNPQFIINQSGTNINNTGLTVSQNGGPTGAYILVNSASNAWTLKAGAGSLVTLNQDVSTTSNVNFNTATLSGLTLNQDTISLGTNVNAQSYSVGIGYQSLQSSTAPYAVAIGYEAAQLSNTAGYSVALGYKAGQNSQSESSIAIGYEGGLFNQGKWGLSVGYQSGRTGQGQYAIALGFQSAYEAQSTNSIAIGNGAGRTTQQTNSIAIGNGAGYTNQGSNCIAIGQNAGNTNQANGSIILNGTSNNFNTTTSGFFVNPVRNVTNSQLVQYNTSTNELTYSNNATLNNLTSTNFTGTIANINNVTTNKVQFGGLGSIYFQTGSATGCFIDGIRNATGSSNLIYNSTTKEITYTTPNYLYAYYTGTQQTSSTSYTGVLFNQVPILDGFTHTTNTALFSFTADTNGIYQITYSLEVHNDNNSTESLTAYLDIDGTPISGSARSVSISVDTDETTLSHTVLSNISSGSHTIQVLMRSTNADRITIQNPTDVPSPGLAGSAATLTVHRII